jgi:hypothetical protein
MNESTVSTPASFSVDIIYNGVEKPLSHVELQQQVTSIFQRSLQLFDVRDRQHVYALFTLGGQEIANNQTVQAAGIGPGSKLLLREKMVSGG